MSDTGDFQALIRSAEQLEEEGAIDEALDQWQVVLDRDRDPLILCRFGLLALKANRPETAFSAFTEAIEIDPELPEGMMSLGLWHRDRGNLETAADFFERGVSLAPTSSNLILLGTTKLQLGDTIAAQNALNEATRSDPDNDEAYYNLGLTFLDTESSKAIFFFRKALEIDPDFSLAHSELGQALRRLSQNEAAEYHLRRAIDLDNTDLWARLYLANILWLKGELPLAEELFKKAIELSPTYSVPYWCLGNFYEHLGRSEEAGKLYERAVVIAPSDAEAHAAYGLYLKNIGEIEKAKVQLERARALDLEDE